jgi:photosystem II stability/assembly factor-like uncharacterized protein
MWAASPTELYAVGDGVVLHGDGSGHWTIRARGKEVAGMSAIWGSSATDVYAVGNAGILHSTDGGVRWIASTQAGDEALAGYASIWGSSADDIYVTGFSTVHSTDRGKTWMNVPRATSTGRFTHVFGRSAKDVWLVGQEHSARPFSPALILHSSDNGKTWQTQRRDTSLTTGIEAFFANDKVAIALPGPTDETLLRSTNAGRTWQSITTGLGDQKPAVINGSGSDIFLATSSGKVLKTGDAGKSWALAAGETGLTLRQIGEAAMIEDLCVVGDSLYAVGFGGVVLRSRAGAPWVVEAGSLLDKDLNAVWGTSSKNVYAAGDDGTIVRSSDEGETWRDVAPPHKPGAQFGARYTSMWGSGPSDIYVVGDTDLSHALILHSANGTTFLEQAAPSGVGELVAVWGSDAEHVYAAGLHEILRTTDHGASWQSVWKDPGARLTRLTGGGGSIAATGWSGASKQDALLVESTDGGALWHAASGKPSMPLHGIWKTKRGALLGTAYGPKIHRSVDNGVTWSTEPIAFDGHMNTIGGSTTDDTGEVFAAGFNGALFSSKDDGKVWEKIDTKLDWTQALHAIWVSPEGEVFVVGDAGIVLHRR